MAEATPHRMVGAALDLPSAGAAPTIRTVTHRDAVIDPEAHVGDGSIIGTAGEWRSEPTRHPAHVQAGATVRENVTVQAGCERPTIIGPRTLLMSGCYIAHDVQLGADCEVGAGAALGGAVTTGDRVRIGMNATILPRVTIGDRARIGAGSVVRSDVPPGQTWAGNPARRIR